MHLHHFTSEVEARIVFPEIETLEPGQEAMAQLRTATPVVPSTGDRFVIRASSPSITLGGGVILNPRGVKLRARSAKAFVELDKEDEVGIVAALVRSGGLAGVTKNELLGLSGLPAKRLDKALDVLRNARTVIRFDRAEDRMVHQEFFEIVKKRLVKRLAAFHADHPLKEGISKQELRSAAPGGDKLFKAVLEFLTAKSEAVDQGNTVRSASHTVKLKEDEQGLSDKLLKLIVDGKNAPPVVKEIVAAVSSDVKRVRNLLGVLEKEGKVVRVKEDIYFSVEFINETKRKLVEFIGRSGAITPSQLGEVTGSSRKYNIPLLEYFDRERFTIRVGDQRVLRDSGASGAGGKVE